MSTLKPSNATGQPSSDRPDPETVSLSGYEIDGLYGPGSVPTADPKDPTRADPRIATPGEYPFTRGVHPKIGRAHV